MWSFASEGGQGVYTMPAAAAKVFAKSLDQVAGGWRQGVGQRGDPEPA